MTSSRFFRAIPVSLSSWGTTADLFGLDILGAGAMDYLTFSSFSLYYTYSVSTPTVITNDSIPFNRLQYFISNSSFGEGKISTLAMYDKISRPSIPAFDVASDIVFIIDSSAQLTSDAFTRVKKMRGKTAFSCKNR